MKTACCLAAAILLSAAVPALGADGDEPTNPGKASDVDPRIQELTQELKAQRALLEIQSAEIKARKAAEKPSLSLDGTPLPSSMQGGGQKEPAKPALPEVVKS